MKRLALAITLTLGLLPMSAFAADTVIQCPYDPTAVVFGVQFGTNGACQGPIGALGPAEGQTIRMLLPSPTCFPTGAQGIRVSIGPGLDERAPGGMFAAFNGAVTGEIDLFVKNDTAQGTPSLWLGMQWTCREPQPAASGPTGPGDPAFTSSPCQRIIPRPESCD